MAGICRSQPPLWSSSAFPTLDALPKADAFPATALFPTAAVFSLPPGGSRARQGVGLTEEASPGCPGPCTAFPSLGRGWEQFSRGGIGSAGSRGPGCWGWVSGDITSHPPPAFARMLQLCQELRGHLESLMDSSKGPHGRQSSTATALEAANLPTAGSPLTPMGAASQRAGVYLQQGTALLVAQGHASPSQPGPGSPIRSTPSSQLLKNRLQNPNLEKTPGKEPVASRQNEAPHTTGAWVMG